MSDDLSTIHAYHEETKHRMNRYARSLGYMDWDTQPDPFRNYEGAEAIRLQILNPVPNGEGEPDYDDVLDGRGPAPCDVTFETLSRLFFDALAISGWRSAGGDSFYAKRVNPSSGNLHPTEGYLVCGPLAELADAPGVYHYAPKDHILEKRTEFSSDLWREMTAGLPDGSFLLGLTSIYWRESWKYGERAFRYSHHDVGHAIGALAVAAAELGWQVRVVEPLGTQEMGTLLGVEGQSGMEAEHADCVLAVMPCEAERVEGVEVNVERMRGALAQFSALEWRGEPNVLSASHVEWPIIDEASDATKKPPTDGGGCEVHGASGSRVASSLPSRGHSLRQLVRKRRSAVSMDGVTSMSDEAFYRLLARLLPGVAVPFHVLPWEPLAHLAVFVHRVDGLEPGLYLLVRNSEKKATLQEEMAESFLWEKPDTCPPELELYRLTRGDMRALAAGVSCNQEIASDSCFALGMLVEFEAALAEKGAWFYPRLYWETGLIGQMLYLEAEAAGLRGTGIGCFFDDMMHRTLGLQGKAWQSLYHFTVGGAMEDPRLTMEPAYADKR